MASKRAVQHTRVRLGEYLPKDPDAAKLYATHSEMFIRILAHRDYTDRNQMTTYLGLLIAFATWAESQGMWSRESGEPLPVSQRLTQLFCEHRMDQGYAGAQSSYSVLKSVGIHHQPHLWPRQHHPYRTRNPDEPYTAAQQTEYRTVAREFFAQTGDARLLATIAGGFGAGLSPGDLRVVTGDDIYTDDNTTLVRVRGSTLTDRDIPVVPDWAEDLRQAAATLGSQLLTSGRRSDSRNHTQRVTVPFRTYADLHISLRQVRSTWLIGRLAAGVPSKILIAYAGLQSTQMLRDLHPLVPDWPENVERRFLTHGARPC